MEFANTANRLAEIERTTNKSDWKYVSTNLNAADDVTNGLWVYKFMRKSKWLLAPNYLMDCPITEPQQPVELSRLVCDEHELSSPKNAFSVVFAGPDSSEPVMFQCHIFHHCRS